MIAWECQALYQKGGLGSLNSAKVYQKVYEDNLHHAGYKKPRKNRGLINIYGGGIRPAISDGLREGDNPAAWRDGLEHRLPSAEKTKNKRKPEEERHHEALPHTELPVFMIDLATMDGMGARALELLILNANRTD